MLQFGLLAGLGVATDSFAQEATSGAGVEEIVVTAEKREGTAQRTPMAITALSGEDLASEGQFELDEIIRSTPSVEVQTTNGGGTVFIRGIGTNDTGFGDPAINLNIDGVYQQDAGPVTGGLYDINRIEILRGPQGTLYGRNATAGSINIVTNLPTPEFEGSLSVTMGNFDLFRTEGVLNAPLGDNAAVRGAFFTNAHEGYIQPSGYNDADQFGGRLTGLFDVSNNVRIVASASYLSEEGEGIGTVPAGVDTRSDPWESTLTPGVSENEYWSFRTQLDLDLGAATLTVLPSFTHTDRFANSLSVPNGGALPVVQTESTEQTALEVRLASNDINPLNWLVGAFYLDGEYTRNDDGPFLLPGTAIVGTTASPALYQTQPLQSYAAFGQLTYAVTDVLRLTGGLRYSRDEKDQFNDRVDHVLGTVTTNPHTAQSWDSLDYRLGIEFDLTSNSLLYATASTAYKAGGFSTRPPAGVAAVPYEPEDMVAYEIGSKNRFFDDRFQINLSAYHYAYDNYQVKHPTFLDPPPPPVVVLVETENAGDATVWGGELESIFQATPTDRFNFSVSYTHAQFGFFQYTSLGTLLDFSNAQMPNAPELVANIGYEHDWIFADGGSLTARIESKLSSGYWSTVERTTDSYQPDYTRSEASISYNAPDDRWSLRGYVKNIEDEPVRTGGGQAGPPSTAFLFLQPPRTYGVSLVARF